MSEIAPVISNDHNGQKPTLYRPKGVARKLLDVLLNPEHRFKSVSEICRIAKIGRDSYYRLGHDKDFVCYYTQESQRFVKMHQGPMVGALVKSAVRGNPQNLRVALMMANLHKEKGGLTLNPDADGMPQPVRFQTDMEIAVKLARILFGNKQVVEYVMARIKNGNNATDNAGADGTLDRGTDTSFVIPGAE